MLVVMSIIGILSTFLVSNFSRARVDVNRAVPQVISDIRDTQVLATSSAKYNGLLRCGYGVHYLTITTYRIYTRPISVVGDCTSTGRNYKAAIDLTVRDVVLIASGVQFTSAFSDIYFEPPNPTTYIDGVSTLNGVPASLTLGPKGADCLNNSLCKTICVYPSGKNEVVIGSSANCPGL